MSRIWYFKKTKFQKLNLFLSSGEGEATCTVGYKTTSVTGPIQWQRLAPYSQCDMCLLNSQGKMPKPFGFPNFYMWLKYEGGHSFQSRGRTECVLVYLHFLYKTSWYDAHAYWYMIGMFLYLYIVLHLYTVLLRFLLSTQAISLRYNLTSFFNILGFPSAHFQRGLSSKFSM
jgi:hypothetical protein